jgi:hypothetical protein
MAKENNILEEAIIQMKNLEEAVAENAKGILASTMKQEIKQLVKESLNEQDDEEEVEDEEEIDMDSDVADVEFPDDEEEVDDEEDYEEDYEEGDYTDEYSDEEEDDEEDEEVLDLRNLDQTGMSKEEQSDVLFKVFKSMGPQDKVQVEEDPAGNIRLKDEENDTEYMIVRENYHMDEEEYMESDYMDEGMYHEMDENYMDEDYMSTMDEDYMSTMDEDYMSTMDEDYMSTMDEEDFEREDKYKDILSKFDEDTIYEIEMEEEEEEEEFYESLYEAKKSMKPKGMGMGSASKFKYSKKPNQEGGFKEDMKQGTRGVGMGKVKKDIYKSDSPSFDGEFSKKPTKSKETKGSMKMKPKKVETKEASRTLGNGKYWGRDGLPKPRTAPRHLREESIDLQEMEILREKNEEYRKALNIFRNKLNEVAVFNSNLAYATRLFTEHSTSKQEKINILKRFDDVESLKESKTLYKIIKDELTSSKPQQVNESIERTINKVPTNGSAINLIESKTYENPQFMRMKDLMSKLK